MKIILYVGALIAIFFLGLAMGPLLSSTKEFIFPAVEYEAGDYSGFYEKASADVVIFTEAGCPFCAQAITLIEGSGMHYKKYELDKGEGLEEYSLLGGRVVPITLIGDRKILGYKQQEILDALGHLENETNRRD